MIRRSCGISLLAFVLLGLVVYSQMRPRANYVSGLIEAEEIRLGSRVGGRVKAVLVKEGDRVTRSTPLVEFEPYDLKEQVKEAIAILAEREAAHRRLSSGMREEEVAQAKSRYEQALSQLSLVEEGPRPEEIAAAENRLASAQSAFQLAEREFGRLSSLLESKAVSKSEFDRASEQLDVARSTVAVRRNELKILQSGARTQEIEMAKSKVDDLRLSWTLAKKGFRDEDIEQAKAARDAAVASLDALRKHEEELTIHAPANGTIDSLDLQPGDLVAPNAPVMTLMSDKELWVRAYVPQRFLQLRVGQRLRVSVDSFPDEDFWGHVTFIARQAEFTPSNVQTPDDRARQVYRIRVTLKHESDRLRPGMTANVWLDTSGEGE